VLLSSVCLCFSFYIRLPVFIHEVHDVADPQYDAFQWRTQEFFWEGVQQIQLRTEDRENRDLGGDSPLVRDSGGSCNLVKEISFHIVKFS